MGGKLNLGYCDIVQKFAICGREKYFAIRGKEVMNEISNILTI
jgi:hypothetical protein